MPSFSTSAGKKKVIMTLVAFAAIYTIWGTTYLAIRIAVGTMPPFFMAGVRFLIAGGVTFAFLRARGAARPSRIQWRSAAIIGALLLVGGNGLVTWSEQRAPSSIAALVVATVPMWMALLDWLVYKGPRPSKRVAAGLVIGFLGLGILIGPGQFPEAAAIGLPTLLVLFMAPFLWSLGSLHSRRAALPQNAFLSTSMEMLAGGFLLLIAGFLTGEGSRLDLAAISAQSFVAMLYLALFGSIVALTAYVWLLKNVQAARVATYTYVNPIIAIFLGWLILNEPITAGMLAAVAVIILAVALITTPPPKRKTAQPGLTPVLKALPAEPASPGD